MDAPGSWDEVYALPNLRQHDCQDIPEDDDEDDEKEDGEGSGCSRGGEEDGGDAAGQEGDSNGIGGEELLQMVTELGHRRLEAAAKVFEDSMAVLRDNRNRVVEVCSRFPFRVESSPHHVEYLPPLLAENLDRCIARTHPCCAAQCADMTFVSNDTALIRFNLTP